jgi:hypothetical protein
MPLGGSSFSLEASAVVSLQSAQHHEQPNGPLQSARRALRNYGNVTAKGYLTLSLRFAFDSH